MLSLLALAASALATRRGGSANRVSAVAPTTTRAAATTGAPATTRAATSTLAPTTTTSAATTPPSTAPVTVARATVAPTAAATAPPPPASGSGSLAALAGKTIAIDPGHDGGNYAHTTEINRPVFIGTMTRACDTTGTETDNGYTEAAYTLDVSLRLRAVLQAAGANVVMTRTTNDGWGPCIDQRAAIGNDAHAAAAISIHADGGPPNGRGFHVLMPAFITGYTDDIYTASHRLGVDVRDAFEATGMPTSTYYGSDGLAERSDLGGLNLSNVPKVFIETGNMRNSTDTSLLEDANFRQREAQQLAVGLARFVAGQ